MRGTTIASSNLPENEYSSIIEMIPLLLTSSILLLALILVIIRLSMMSHIKRADPIVQRLRDNDNKETFESMFYRALGLPTMPERDLEKYRLICHRIVNFFEKHNGVSLKVIRSSSIDTWKKIIDIMGKAFRPKDSELSLLWHQTTGLKPVFIIDDPEWNCRRIGLICCSSAIDGVLSTQHYFQKKTHKSQRVPDITTSYDRFLCRYFPRLDKLLSMKQRSSLRAMCRTEFDLFYLCDYLNSLVRPCNNLQGLSTLYGHRSDLEMTNIETLLQNSMHFSEASVLALCNLWITSPASAQLVFIIAANKFQRYPLCSHKSMNKMLQSLRSVSQENHDLNPLSKYFGKLLPDSYQLDGMIADLSRANMLVLRPNGKMFPCLNQDLVQATEAMLNEIPGALAYYKRLISAIPVTPSVSKSQRLWGRDNNSRRNSVSVVPSCTIQISPFCS